MKNKCSRCDGLGFVYGFPIKSTKICFKCKGYKFQKSRAAAKSRYFGIFLLQRRNGLYIKYFNIPALNIESALSKARVQFNVLENRIKMKYSIDGIYAITWEELGGNPEIARRL